MAIKVGNSWVSEASYALAKAKIKTDTTKNSEKVTIQSLSKKFSGTNFSTNIAPFNGNGRNNIAIAPNILSQMNNDPEKRLEYEALIYDCAALQKTLTDHTITGSKLKAQGFIINSDGTLGSWSITEPSEISGSKKHTANLPKNDKESWLDRILRGDEAIQAATKKNIHFDRNA